MKTLSPTETFMLLMTKESIGRLIRIEGCLSLLGNECPGNEDVDTIAIEVKKVIESLEKIEKTLSGKED